MLWDLAIPINYPATYWPLFDQPYNMDYESFRKRYPRFEYRSFSWHISGLTLHTVFNFSLPADFAFNHEVIFTFPTPPISTDIDENLIFHLGLSEMFSYWKAACSPQVIITAGGLDEQQTAFWHKLFIKGMGEYFYRNKIDFTVPRFLTLTSAVKEPVLKVAGSELSGSQVLVPVGGGKDSIVTLELLKNNFNITPFVVNSVPVINSVLQKSGVSSPITVERVFDPQLFKLNGEGFLNGHIPVSAFYAFSSILGASVLGIKYIAFSNESSSNEGNTTFQGHEINHQYSKTAEFESDLTDYLKYINTPVSCFSFLRPLSELQITSVFSNYPHYFPIFTSCNNNFKMDPEKHPQGSLWCKKCPKCVSTALLLASFLGKDRVSEIMGAFPPDLPENRQILNELLGLTPVKPFECVLSRAEAQAALEKITTGSLEKFSREMSVIRNSTNLPENFAGILTKAL